MIGRLLYIFVFSFLAVNSYAGDWWTINLTPQLVAGNYPGSPIRNQLTTAGGIADFQYLERYGFAVGNTRLNLKYHYDIPSLHQDFTYFSVRKYLTPDTVSGVLTLRLDAYRITGNDPTNETDNTSIIAPIASFINYESTYYFDVAYAFSKYGTSTFSHQGLNLSQLTSTVGWSITDDMNWVYYRFYGIHSSNPLRSTSTRQTYGSEFIFSHYIVPSYAIIPKEIDMGVFFGQRMYAVDNSARIVYNLGDIQQSGVYLQAIWDLNPNVSFLLNAGSQNYISQYYYYNFSYKLNYVAASVNFRI